MQLSRHLCAPAMSELDLVASRYHVISRFFLAFLPQVEFYRIMIGRIVTVAYLGPSSEVDETKNCL